MDERIIFHIDVNNAFLSWTAVKLLNEGLSQDIRNIPSIIAGSEKERHGIVLAKSTIAKKYNIKTAETVYQAQKKCPNIKIFPPDYQWYLKKSQELFEYLAQYSPTIEQFSIDECFIDMTGTKYLYKNYIELAYKIKKEIKEQFGYTVNIGVANNKLCAKMASDFEKPDKVHSLFKSEIKSKLWPLPIEDLFMVGEKTKERLNKININTIGDLANCNDKLLQQYFKNQANYLKNAANGMDNSEVKIRTDKTSSISISQTLPQDCSDKEKLKEYLLIYAEETTRKLRTQKQYAKTVVIFYKTSNFKIYSSQASLENPSNNTNEIYKLALNILEKSYNNLPVRLIGLKLTNFVSDNNRQLSFFENIEQDKNNSVQQTIDKLNEKFGKTVILPASIKIINSKSRNKEN